MIPSNFSALPTFDKQNPNGSWGKHEGDKKDEDTWDTCFAVLFLKKATRAIATEGGSRK